MASQTSLVVQWLRLCSAGELRSFLLHDMAKKRQIYKYLKILKFNQKKQQNDKTYDI